MIISFDWLKQYLEIQESPEKIGQLLTDTGLEVEGISEFQLVEGGFEGLVIGEVISCEKHENADTLSVTTVDLGEDEPVQIVCGAPNVAKGQKVVVAKVGAVLYPKEGDPVKIKKGKIRGELSMGMICAEDEIGVGNSHDGIMVLDTTVPNGTSAADFFNVANDSIVEIGLTPNRADGASHVGVARDLKAVLKREVKLPSVDEFRTNVKSNLLEIVLEDSVACPRYSGLVIEGLQVKESPDWLKKRLKSIGINPTNNVVDVTNFVLHELGQPLHAFDLKQVGNKIVVKTGLGDHKFKTLDEKERKLFSEDLMICNAEKPMCIAGVLGGLDSGVSESTTSIFLESAYFSPEYVRKSSMKHGIKTDASFRFERGTDPEITVYALKRAALLIQEVAGGEITSDILDHYPQPIQPKKIALKYSRIDKLIGVEIGNDRINEILEDLDFKITTSLTDDFEVEAPLYRVDVTREADVIEEIIRIYGYNNFEARPISAGYIARFDKPGKVLLKDKIADILSSGGFSEIITNSITNSKYFDQHDFLNKDWLVKILNYNSEELDVLRTNMIFSALEVLKSNINRKQKNLKLYEFGKVYALRDGKYEEKEKLSIVMYGNVTYESWRGKEVPLRFVDVFSVFSKLVDRLGIEVKTEPMENPNKFAFGLKIFSVSGKLLGRIGVINAVFSEQFGIESNVFMIDLNWDTLVNLHSAKMRYKEISRYPKVRRDLSLVLDSGITFDAVKEVAFKTERKLLTGINVFDVYAGSNLGEGKKSYSVSFDLQDQDKTLNDKMIDKTMDRLIHAYEQELGALIRR